MKKLLIGIISWVMVIGEIIIIGFYLAFICPIDEQTKSEIEKI